MYLTSCSPCLACGSPARMRIPAAQNGITTSWEGGGMATRTTAKRTGAIRFHHPGAFWFGITAATVGTLLTLPEYFSARHNCKVVPLTVPGSPLVKQCYVLAGKGMDAAMTIGMLLMLVGIAATAYGLFPRLSEVSKRYIS